MESSGVLELRPLDKGPRDSIPTPILHADLWLVQETATTTRVHARARACKCSPITAFGLVEEVADQVSYVAGKTSVEAAAFARCQPQKKLVQDGRQPQTGSPRGRSHAAGPRLDRPARVNGTGARERADAETIRRPDRTHERGHLKGAENACRRGVRPLFDRREGEPPGTPRCSKRKDVFTNLEDRAMGDRMGIRERQRRASYAKSWVNSSGLRSQRDAPSSPAIQAAWTRIARSSALCAYTHVHVFARGTRVTAGDCGPIACPSPKTLSNSSTALKLPDAPMGF
jgi:hypothetical protein